MKIKKSSGITPTENLLAELCERTFLGLWSYPNPKKEDGKELCDLLAVFGNHVFIFHDRETKHLNKDNGSLELNWRRWEKEGIGKQIKSAHQAEGYIRRGRDIFLDAKCTTPLPVSIDLENVIIHKIVVAHGAKDACLEDSPNNIYGSLAIRYTDPNLGDTVPFMIRVDRNKPVHIFDSHNLPILLGELDTFFDFANYLDAKISAIRSVSVLSYCGEEDLLAHYFHNFDLKTNRHFIGIPDENITGLHIGEGDWKTFVESKAYKVKESENEISYLWDHLIQKSCQNALDGTLLGDGDPANGKSAIYEMAKEPRFWRRNLAKNIIQAIQTFPDTPSPMMCTNLTFFSSFFEDKGYVFLQVKMDAVGDYATEYRPKRQAMLHVACGVAKNKFPHLKTVIGIAIDAPKFTEENSEDFLLMDCSEWGKEKEEFYTELNSDLNFFHTAPHAVKYEKVQEFPDKKTAKN